MIVDEERAMKASIEVQLDEYDQSIVAYRAWKEAWRGRQSGFRCKRRNDCLPGAAISYSDE